jgi:dUTPase
MSKLTLKIFVHEGGKAPQPGKPGDAGLDCFACLPADSRQFAMMVNQFELAKVPLGFSYSFSVGKEISHDYWLDIRNRSGVGTKSGFVTVAEVGDANYRGVIHYCAVKTLPGAYPIEHGAKICQAIINPFVDPAKVDIVVVGSLEELGQSARGEAGFGSSGT